MKQEKLEKINKINEEMKSISEAINKIEEGFRRKIEKHTHNREF